MRPVRVAVVRQRYADDGGAERFVARMLEAFRGRPIELALVTREWSDGGTVEFLKCNPFYLGRLWRDSSFARGVCRLLRSRRFDLVQSHERIACCDIYRAGDGVHAEWLEQRSRALGALARLSLALNPYHRYLCRAERRLFQSPRLRAVICNSHMVKDEIMRRFGLPAERLHVIYNGVDTRAFHPDLKRHRGTVRAQHGIAADAPLFLFVGSGFERKGLAAALAALAPVRDAHLLVVGRDKHAARFQRHAHRLGIAGRVHFVGKQPDVKPYYGAADALVLPTLYDPFPNVALEAMAAGLPVITSRKCGAAEIIKDNENGYVCDAIDVAALHAAMTKLIPGAPRAAMGAAARRTVEALDFERMTTQLLTLYRACSAHNDTR